MWFAQTSDELLLNSTDYTYTTTSVDTGAAGAALGAMFAIYMFVWLAVAVIAIIAMWKIFTKAGQAGWKSIIPFYNMYVLLQIVGRPGWWLLLFFVPIANIVVSVIVALDLAKSFGRSELFGIVGLFLFSLIGYLMLAFGKDTYRGPAALAGATTPPPAAPTQTPAAG